MSLRAKISGEEADGAASVEDARDALLRAQARQIEAQAAMLERQAKWLDTLMAGQGMAVREPVASVAAAVEAAPKDTLTVAELWTAYVASLGARAWLRNIEIMMQRPLRYFAPSLAAKKFRAGRFRHVVVQGPDMLVAALRPHHWLTFRDWVRTNDAGVGVTTRNMMLTRMQACLNWSVAAERIAISPLARVKQEPRKPRRETTITDEQLDQMLAAEESPVFRAYMLAASDSGMRSSEVRHLKWDQIDFTTGRVKLSWTETKSKRSRVVRLSPRAMDAIRALPRTADYVFVSPRGRLPYSKKRIWLWFRKAVAAAGIKPAPGDGSVTFHDSTRHTFASRMHKSGATLKEIQVALGHSSIQTTSLYLHTDEDALDKAHARLHGAVRKGPKNKAHSSRGDGTE